MSMDWIRKNYSVPAKRGGRVEYTGGKTPEFGTIVGAREGRLRIRLDGMEYTHPLPFHPTYELRYLDAETPSPQPRSHAIAVLEKLREEIGDAYEKGIPRPSTLLEWCQFIDNALAAPAPQVNLASPNERLAAAMQSVRDRDIANGYHERTEKELRLAASEILMRQDREAGTSPAPDTKSLLRAGAISAHPDVDALRGFVTEIRAGLPALSEHRRLLPFLEYLLSLLVSQNHVAQPASFGNEGRDRYAQTTAAKTITTQITKSSMYVPIIDTPNEEQLEGDTKVPQLEGNGPKRHNSPAPQINFRVKPLEWLKGSWGRELAYGIDGRYSYEVRGPFDRHPAYWMNQGTGLKKTDVESLEEAKSAAQADYEARVLAALVAPSPQPREVGSE